MFPFLFSELLILNNRMLTSHWASTSIFTLIIVILRNVVVAEVKSFEFMSVRLFPQPSEHLLVHVDSPSQHFTFRLQQDHSVFANDFVLDDGSKNYFKDHSTFSYIGTVADWPGSRVIASIANRRLEAVVFFNRSVSNALFIEDGHRYRVDCSKDTLNDLNDPHYCTIAYRDKFDHDPYSHEHSHHGRSKRSEEFSGICGWADPTIAARLQEWMRDSTSKLSVQETRTRRAADARMKVCTLYIQIDKTMWTLYMDDFNNNAASARAALTRLSADLVQGMNEVYSATSFVDSATGAGPYTGFVFQLAKMRIFTSDGVCKSTNAIEKQLCNDFIDSDAFLKINSQMDHRAYCLAFIISHRQFSGGVMGLAWLGYPSGYIGGVCQQPTGSLGATLSYNTGIITGNNQGNRVSKRSLMLTFAHEVGHNFGAPHDTTPDCVPSSSSGYYLMYPYVNPGDKSNNDKFSSCSKAKIAQNLEAVLAGRSATKPNCFRDKLVPVCGNQIVEEGEECDCGETDEECRSVGKDKCCTPADGGPYACRLTRTAKCSPSQGPCCDGETCQLIPASTKKVCAIQSECSEQSVCSGLAAVCPPARPKSNVTFCASKTRTCLRGECSQSVCKMINYDECQEPFDKTKDASRYCYLSCIPVTGNNKKCLNSLEPGDDYIFKHLITEIGGGKPIKLPPGSPCDNYRGVCDTFSRCRLVNVQGPLARLFSVLNSESSVQTAGEWLVHYWWVVAICSVVFIAISFILLKFCSDLLPTSNPKFQGGMTVGEAVGKVFKPSLRRRRPNELTS